MGNKWVRSQPTSTPGEVWWGWGQWGMQACASCVGCGSGVGMPGKGVGKHAKEQAGAAVGQEGRGLPMERRRMGINKWYHHQVVFYLNVCCVGNGRHDGIIGGDIRLQITPQIWYILSTGGEGMFSTKCLAQKEEVPGQ